MKEQSKDSATRSFSSLEAGLRSELEDDSNPKTWSLYEYFSGEDNSKKSTDGGWTDKLSGVETSPGGTAVWPELMWSWDDDEGSIPPDVLVDGFPPPYLLESVVWALAGGLLLWKMSLMEGSSCPPGPGEPIGDALICNVHVGVVVLSSSVESGDSDIHVSMASV